MLRLKIFIAKILCSDFVGKFLSYFFKNKFKYNNVLIDTSNKNITSRVKASLFWKLYESSEAYFVKKYIKDDLVVVELGGSIGVISCLIGKNAPNQLKLIVEANPQLISSIQSNYSLNSISNFQIINKAYSSNQNDVYFLEGRSNELGKISENEIENSYKIQSINLKNILHHINYREFVLVCDIEGAELDLIINESDCLNLCKMIIVEIHQVTYDKNFYNENDVLQFFLSKGFQIIERRGPNVVLIRSNKLR